MKKEPGDIFGRGSGIKQRESGGRSPLAGAPENLLYRPHCKWSPDISLVEDIGGVLQTENISKG
jgi:hypothetical protein